jgi:hypothetical protein
MPEQCGAEVPEDVDEHSRDDRIECYYQAWGARDMAERIVELEDELGADVDGISTGMHADVAEAHAEVERLASLVGYWEHRAEESDRLREHAGSLYEMFKRLRDEEADRADRFESAWKSARRRASRAMGAWRSAQHSAESWRRASRDAGQTLREVLGLLHARTGERDRYRLAWLSARRRVADEANFGLEALELKELEIQRLRALLDEGPRVDSRT